MLLYFNCILDVVMLFVFYVTYHKCRWLIVVCDSDMFWSYSLAF